MDMTSPGGFKIISNIIVDMTVAIKPKFALIFFNHYIFVFGDNQFPTRFTNFLQTLLSGFSVFGISTITPPQL
jgi:hypothetical protein